MTTYIVRSIYYCECCMIALELSAEGRTVKQAEDEVISTVKMFEISHENSQRHKEIMFERNVYNKEIVAYING